MQIMSKKIKKKQLKRETHWTYKLSILAMVVALISIAIQTSIAWTVEGMRRVQYDSDYAACASGASNMIGAGNCGAIDCATKSDVIWSKYFSECLENRGYDTTELRRGMAIPINRE